MSIYNKPRVDVIDEKVKVGDLFEARHAPRIFLVLRVYSIVGDLGSVFVECMWLDNCVLHVRYPDHLVPPEWIKISSVE